MKKRFTVSAILFLSIIILVLTPVFAITFNDAPRHVVKVPERLVKTVVLESTPTQVEVQSVETKKHDFTEKEVALLERLVHAEAEGEPFIGKVAVANVVLNRIKSDKYPNTMNDVIYQKRQFSPISDGRINNTPSEESKFAVKMALEGYLAIPEDVGFFYEPNSAQTHWIGQNKELYGIIGHHHFYYE